MILRCTEHCFARTPPILMMLILSNIEFYEISSRANSSPARPALSTVSCLAIVSAARVTAAMASMGIKIYSVNASFPHGQPL